MTVEAQIVGFAWGFTAATALGFLAALDALVRAGRAGVRVTTWRRAASWWFWRNPEGAEA